MRLSVPSSLLLVSAAFASPPPTVAEDFWEHWGDGRAELNGYRLTQPRYGSLRSGSAVLIFVTEDFSDAQRVKAESRPGATSGVYPVMKLNHLRQFQTGIYDYSTMTSVFARVASGWPVRKVSFSSQDWCGQVWHQLLPTSGRIDGLFHSYFEGEADGRDELNLPDGGVFEDALPILLRGLDSVSSLPLPAAGASRAVPWLPSLLSRRLNHLRLAWGRATLSRASSSVEVTVPAGKFRAVTYTVAVEGGGKTQFSVEEAWPHRLLKWSSDSGEEAALVGSSRQPYWKQNGLGGEKYLAELGLRPPTRLP
jgi:hypothetical protein